MNTSISTPLLLALAGVAGILVGLLVSTLFKSDSKAGPEGNPLPKKFVDAGFAEAARLYYSPAIKKALTQLDGDFYNDFAALTPEQKRRVIRILQAWQEWSGQYSPLQNEPQNAVPPLPVEAQSKAEPAAARQPVSALQFMPSELTSEEIPEVVPAAAKPLTIFEQIDEILKEVVAASPEKNRGIRLVDNGHNGVIVWVGMEKFNGVDEVPYPEVQALIHTAVERWEAQAEALNRPEPETPTK